MKFFFTFFGLKNTNYLFYGIRNLLKGKNKKGGDNMENKMKKIAINACYGGFTLSQLALEKLIQLGWEKIESETCKEEIQKIEHILSSEGRLFVLQSHKPDFRTHPDVIKVIEELGPEAGEKYSAIIIEEIPFEHEWEIQEYDGCEEVVDLGIISDRYGIKLSSGHGLKVVGFDVEVVKLTHTTLFTTREEAERELYLRGLEGEVLHVVATF